MFNKKIALISDTHIGAKGNDEHLLESTLKICDEVIEHCYKEKVSVLFHLGDFFDDRRNINIKTCTKYGQQFIEKLENAEIEFILIGGNHDFYYKKSKDLTAIDLFRKYENIRLIKTPKLLTMSNRKLLLVPWLSTSEEQQAFEEYVKKEDFKNVICLGHFEIKGPFMNNDSRSFSGFDPKLFNKNFLRVYSGHFHKRQEFDNILYVGSTIQVDHGETGQEKGITFVDLNSMEEKFFEFSNVPKHYTIICDSKVLKNPSKILKEIKNKIKGNYIRLNIFSFKENDTILKLEMMLLDHGAIEVKRNFCIMLDEMEGSNDIDFTEEKNIIEIGDPEKLHLNYIQRDEFIEKYTELYSIKIPVLKTIINKLYQEMKQG